MKKSKFTCFSVNPKLYEYAIAELPSNSTPLQEARHIYNRLCKKLNYSVDFYVEEVLTEARNFPLPTPIQNEMSKYAYVETVDGKKNKDVVCFLFSAICSYIFFDRGLISEDDFRNNLLLSETNYLSFENNHQAISCTIDGVHLRIDACMGIDMDLGLAKYGNHILKGWREDFIGNTQQAKDKFLSLLKAESDAIKEKEQQQDLYKCLKISCGDYKKISFDEKLGLFFDAIKDVPEYSFAALTYVSEIYRRIFSSYNINGNTKYIDSTFICENKEVKEYLFVNRKGYKDIEGAENFDNLEIFEISLKDKSIKKTNRMSLLHKILAKESVVFSSKTSKRFGSELMNTGKPASTSSAQITGGRSEK